jgi:hypothetical protein
VGPYRNASLIASRAGKNEATTEELRSALIQYRSLFDSMLGASVPVERAQVERRKFA